ncbi:alpha/beta hydrolase family protein [Nocardioides sediminis]|uniref:alpha/beta hydrolase family protein n=1 Tax=Nocardioides sediminis TaxID=433648 RepID=UPI000D2FBB76|nr:CocE/NonD family hydrolase [Nocardioides sediminis]
MRKLAALALIAPLLAVAGPVTPSSYAAPALAPVAAWSAAAARPAGVKVVEDCLASVPDPGSSTPVQICYSLFKPEGASRKRPVPMIWHSHGWGGSRTKDPAAFATFLEGGYGVLSFDQRGFGESGGHAYVENPAVEGKDVARLIRLMSRLRWVRQDGPGDPRLGAIGGSYGGGYQFLAAFTSLERRGEPVLDAMAPEITWHDLNQSLAPEGVVRTEWALALSAAAVPTDALPPRVYKALAEGAATGTWPDGSVPGTEDMPEFFGRNGPAHHVAQGRRLSIPVLLGQGTTDTLFPLEQGLANWRRALTPRARRDSIFVAYNGGHVLPGLLPRGISVTSDPCSQRLAGGDFEALSRRFFDEQLKGRRTGLRGYGRLHLATPASTCTTVRSPEPTEALPVGTVVSPTAAGAPIAYEIAPGPLRLAGTPHLTGSLTALGVHNRAFYGLAVGTSPADATLVQNNVLPVDEPGPVVGQERRVALPSVAVDVPAGQRLYLLVSALSDTFVGMSSRTPGVVTIEETQAHLPLLSR